MAAAASFSLSRHEIIDRNFVNFCKSASASASPPREAFDQPVDESLSLTGRDLIELFESQITSRHLDFAARELRKQDRGYYTIGSSGHEANAVLGRLTRHTDPAFLHYRSGAFVIERARQLPDQDLIRDTLLGMMASRLDPIAGGRHKVWGSVPLWIIPQTSTIASHLPRAVGAALSFQRARRAGVAPEIPPDSIAFCNFGDASANHSVAAGAINTACYTAFQNLPVPILFLCEDNEIGISVRTPGGWIQAAYSSRPGLRYFQGNGLDLIDTWRAASQAVEHVRRHRRPAFLHLKVVRLIGHAGSDVETEYRTLEEIAAVEARDPLLNSAKLVIDLALLRPEDVLARYEQIRARVRKACDELGRPAKLESAEEIIAPLAPYDPARVNAEATRIPDSSTREAAFGGAAQLPERQPARHMAVNINRGLADLLVKYPEMLIFGEDVAAKGGVYHVTTGLHAKFGASRVFNTLLDETSILGLAIGAGHMGLLPVPEIQYLAYVHNAIDQLRGEACSTQFFSKDQYRNPMVVRINSLAYQKGFGGHFHNDNSIAALRDIPGLVLCVPSRGDDAVRMLRTCMALAKVNGRVAAFLEPIALYMTKDLHEPGDGQWQFAYPAPDQAIALGEGFVYEPEARDLTILTFGNGVYMSLRAAKTLREKHETAARVVDLRWLNPLNRELIIDQSRATGRVLVVDEGRFTGGVSEAILSVLMESCGGEVTARRLTGRDTYIPLGPAANLVLPTEEDVVAAALDLAPRKRRARQPA